MTNDFSDFNALPGRFEIQPPEGRRFQFVVLLHDYPADHWDWMFESANSLLTFRSNPTPFFDEYSKTFPMTLLAPHRLDYLTYEGPISGNRGSVKRLGHGYFQWIEKESRRWVLELAGTNLKGTLTLLPGKNPNVGEIWEATFEVTP